MDLYALFPDLKLARSLMQQSNFDVVAEVYSEILDSATIKCDTNLDAASSKQKNKAGKKPNKNPTSLYERDSPLLCIIYLEYCEALIKSSENYFINEIRVISENKTMKSGERQSKEDDLEIAWDLLELCKSVFMMLQRVGHATTETFVAEAPSEKPKRGRKKNFANNAHIKDDNGSDKSSATNETCFVDLNDQKYIKECLAQAFFLLGEIQLLNNNFLGAIADYTNCMVELTDINKVETVKFCEALYKTATCNEFMKYYNEAIGYLNKMIEIYAINKELSDDKKDNLVNELKERIEEIKYKQGQEEGVEVCEESKAKEEPMVDVPIININSLKKSKKKL